MPRVFDSAYLDQQYNNRALVPEFADHLARWVADSASVRACHACLLDQAYGSGDKESLDIFYPQCVEDAAAAAAPGVLPSKGAPVVVFIHGGYWRGLDKAEHSFIAPTFTQAGALVLVPNYALCPGAPAHPVTIASISLQMVKALAWAHTNAALYGGDPKRITVVGHSAGGHLAAMLLACNWAGVAVGLPASLVKNALSVSGLYELEPLRHTPFLQSSLNLTAKHARMCSPALMPAPAWRKGRGQLHCVAGEDESAEFLRQNQLMRQAWGPRHVPTAAAVPFANHFSVLEEMIRPKTDLHALALSLLA